MAVNPFSNPVEILDVPEGWQIRSIDSLCVRVTSGGTPLRSNMEFYRGGTISWIKTKELNDWYIESSEEKITNLALENSSAKIFPRNTILMAMYGDGKTITSLGILRNEAATNQACCAMIVDATKCHPLYLFYALKFHKSDFIRLATGGAQRNLSSTLIRNFGIRVPPLMEQRAITEVLGALDDKIELNRRMNQTLEAMAAALFKERFVDNPEAKGWESSSLSELFPNDKECVLTGPFGSHLHAHDYRQEGTPILLVKNIMYGNIIEENVPLVGDHKLPDVRRYQLKIGDIVFTRVGAVGRSAYIHPRHEGWLISGQTLRVRIPDRKKINPRYLAQVYLEPSFIGMVESYALGTTRPSLNTSILQSFRFVLPPIEIQDKFAEVALLFDDKIQNNNAENRTLTSLRDALLPKLMRGEVRVRTTD